MTLVTPQDYRDQTGDTTHYWSELEPVLADAQAMVEAALGRMLEAVERTLTLPVHRTRQGGGVVYPPAYPVTAVVSPPTAVIEYAGRRIRLGSSWWPWSMLVEPVGYSAEGPPVADVTFTGGYTPSTLPAPLRRAIVDVTRAKLAEREAAEAGGVSLAGAQSVRFADAAVTYFARPTAAGAMASLDGLVPGIAARLAPWRNPF